MSESSLFLHQRQGALWLTLHERRYLGDRPGLGKTRTLAEALRLDPPRHALVVCPAIVRSHWRKELALVAPDVRVTVKSYDEITRGGTPLQQSFRDVDALVLDEAHYLKHSTAQRTKRILGVNGYTSMIRRVYAASGTPVPRHPGELWTILFALFPDVLAAFAVHNRRTYEARYLLTRRVRLKRYPFVLDKPIGLKHADEFHQMMDQIMLRRTPDMVGLDVPRLFWQELALNAGRIADLDPAWEAAMRDKIARGESLKGYMDDENASRYRRKVGELKAGAVAELLAQELLCSDDKVVVFAHHRSVLKILHDKLRDFGVCYVDGDTPQGKRVDLERAFNTDPEKRVWIGQNIANQTGINLQVAHRAILVEPDWAEHVNDQLGHRIARIGSTAERCIAQMVCLADTLDEAIVRQNVTEARIAAQVYNRDPAPAPITDSDLEAIFR